MDCRIKEYVEYKIIAKKNNVRNINLLSREEFLSTNDQDRFNIICEVDKKNIEPSLLINHYDIKIRRKRKTNKNKRYR